MARPLGRGGHGRVRAPVPGLPTPTGGRPASVSSPPATARPCRCGRRRPMRREGRGGPAAREGSPRGPGCAVQGAFDLAAAQDPYRPGPAGEHLAQQRHHGVVDRFDGPGMEGRVVEHEILDRGGGAAAVQGFPERPEVPGTEHRDRRPGGRRFQHPANLEQLQRDTGPGRRPRRRTASPAEGGVETGDVRPGALTDHEDPHGGKGSHRLTKGAARETELLCEGFPGRQPGARGEFAVEDHRFDPFDGLVRQGHGTAAKGAGPCVSETLLVDGVKYAPGLSTDLPRSARDPDRQLKLPDAPSERASGYRPQRPHRT